ncbi:MAG: hypothetical protein LPK85_12900, partial [Gammaproteobacteria bacterium]|nr:hypothetical protein [Gammaproteobacteria bacterium]
PLHRRYDVLCDQPVKGCCNLDVFLQTRDIGEGKTGLDNHLGGGLELVASTGRHGPIQNVALERLRGLKYPGAFSWPLAGNVSVAGESYRNLRIQKRACRAMQLRGLQDGIKQCARGKRPGDIMNEYDVCLTFRQHDVDTALPSGATLEYVDVRAQLLLDLPTITRWNGHQDVVDKRSDLGDNPF